MDEKAIIKGCLKGDTRAYKQIYDAYGQQLLRTAVRILKNQEDAEDSVQITFMKLHKSIENFRSDCGLKTWIFRILINSCFDISRKNSRGKDFDKESQITYEEDRAELNYSLEQAIERLPNRMRVCFVLFAVEGFKQAEIAEMLEVSIGSVKAAVFNAKAALRKTLSVRKEVV